MREIKFRAWNNKFKEFKFMWLINYLGGRGITDDWTDSEHSVWEQYTGLKDKNLEKRRTLMLDILEEEIITLNKTQAGKFGASEVVVEVNRRMNVKHFTNTDLLHMAETTIKSLKLKGII